MAEQSDKERVLAKQRLSEGKYIDWASAGGPNECEHGFAAGIACPGCDANLVYAASRLPSPPVAEEQAPKERVLAMHPDAYLAGSYAIGRGKDTIDVVVRSTGKTIGSGVSRLGAWADAASRLPSPPVAAEPEASGPQLVCPDCKAEMISDGWLACPRCGSRNLLRPPAPVEAGEAREPDTLQAKVGLWLVECFGEKIAKDVVERNHRYLEEALETVQSAGCERSEAHQLVDYVFDRPVGKLEQEVGGSMLTLAALCYANGVDMEKAGLKELSRVWHKIEVIRAKQAAKPKHSPLPAAPSQPGVEMPPRRVRREDFALPLPALHDLLDQVKERYAEKDKRIAELEAALRAQAYIARSATDPTTAADPAL